MSTKEILIKREKRLTFGNSITYLVLIFFAIIAMYPLIWMIFNSLKTNQDFFANQWIPPFKQLYFQNYITAWIEGNLGRYMLNSIIVTASSIIGLIFVASMISYAFARLKFKGNKFLFYFFLMGLMFPSQVIVIPLFLLISKLGWINSYQALIFPYIGLNLPFAIFLLRAFFLGVPSEIADAAKVDGCNNFDIYWRIMLPIIKPGIAVVAIFSGVEMWNEFLLSLIFMQKENMKTIPAGLMSFFGYHTIEYTILFAGLVIVIMPLIILIILFQNSLVKGLTAGSLKM